LECGKKEKRNRGKMKRHRRGKIAETAGENKEHGRKESHQGTKREVKRGRRATRVLGDQMLVHGFASRMW